MQVIIFGPPGAGKGTQAQRIKDHFNLEVLCVGDIIRHEIHHQTKLGIAVKSMIEAGQLLDDETICRLVQQHIQPQRDMLYDGFPRTVGQLDWFLSQDWLTSLRIIHLQLDDQDIIKRMSGRRVHRASGRVYHLEANPPKQPGLDDVTQEALEQRPDDRPQVVAERLAVYHQETKPVLDALVQLSQTKHPKISGIDRIDAVGGIDEITRCIIQSLEQ